MARAHDESYFRVLQAFLLVVALSPMLCCAGCLGLGMLTALFSPPPVTTPIQKATNIRGQPTDSEGGQHQP